MTNKKKADFKDGPVTFNKGDQAKIEYTIDSDDNVTSEVVVEDTVPVLGKNLPAESAMKVIDKAAEEAKPIKTDGGFNTDFAITQGTAERLANRLNDIPKNSSVDLKMLVETVVDQVEALHREKSRRTQQNSRTISALRASDPKGKKTCKRCAFRVDENKMDSKKELCEVCAS